MFSDRSAATRAVLWIVPKWPLPADDGARIATTSLLRGLSARGWTIDLAAIAPVAEAGPTSEARERLGLREAYLIERPAAAHAPLARAIRLLAASATRPGTPVTMHAYAAPSVREALARRIVAGGYWALVYDGLHPAAHAWHLGRYHRPAGVTRVGLRAHNVEQDIWKRTVLQVRNPLAKLFLKHQAALVGRIEQDLARHADAVATVSSEDLDAFRRQNPAIRGGVVPIGYPFDPAPPHPETPEPPLMFLGRLDWRPNKEGLAWFMREVWPEAIRRRPGLRLTVAGSGDATWFKPHARAPGVTFLGRVERVDELYRDSSIALVPVFFGSGTRVKAIEAGRYGRVCLSTALGVEGTGLEPGVTYVRAETAAEWIDVLSTLDAVRARETGLRAHDALKRRFDPAAAAAAFAALLEGSGEQAPA